MNNIDKKLYEEIKAWINDTYNIKDVEMTADKMTCFFEHKVKPKESFNWGAMAKKIEEIFHVEPTIASGVLIKFIEEYSKTGR